MSSYNTLLYKRIAKIYDILDTIVTPHDKRLIAILQGMENSRVLDVGYGTGKLWKSIDKHEVLGIEPTLQMISAAQNLKKIEVVQCSWEEFDSKEKYQIVLFQHSLSLLTDPEAAIIKAIGLLEENGYIVIQNFDASTLKPWMKTLFKFPAKILNFDTSFSTRNLEPLISQCHQISHQNINPFGLFSLEVYQKSV